MIDRQILQILQGITVEAVAASSTPDLPISYVGVNNENIPPQDQKYLEIVHIPNNPADRYWGEDDKQVYQGLMRLILHWPKNGAGAYTPMDALASISDYFQKDKKYGDHIQIYEKPKFLGTIAEQSEMLYPTSIRYRCFY